MFQNFPKAYYRGGSTLGRGHVLPPPDSLVPPPDSKALTVLTLFLRFQMLQIFQGSATDPAGELTALPSEPLADGEGFVASILRTPARSRPFGPRFYGSEGLGLTHYRVGNPTNDRFKM